MTQLIRKCKCGNMMVVDVASPVVFVSPTSDRRTIAYREVGCVQGCCLSLSVYGIKFAMPILNKDNIFRAVYCIECNRTRHLNLFTKPQV